MSFIELCLTEHGEKKSEALKKIAANFRGESAMDLPDVKPVNER